MNQTAVPSTPGSNPRGSSFQVADQGGTSGFGPKQYTPWASEVTDGNGGWSEVALDADAYDPDAVRIKLQTRDWPSPRTLKDIRIGIQLYDFAGTQAGPIVYTPWATEGGGWSPWALDLDGYDPDGVKLKLEVRVE